MLVYVNPNECTHFNHLRLATVENVCFPQNPKKPLSFTAAKEMTREEKQSVYISN